MGRGSAGQFSHGQVGHGSVVLPARGFTDYVLTEYYGSAYCIKGMVLPVAWFDRLL